MYEFLNNKIFISFMCLFLVFTIIFNFSIKPKAEAITMSLGVYIFFKSLLATGVAVSSYIVADKVTQEGIDLYNEFQEYNNKNPLPDPIDDKASLATLLGTASLSSTKYIDKVKDFFISLKPNLNEGSNSFGSTVLNEHFSSNRFDHTFEFASEAIEGSWSGVASYPNGSVTGTLTYSKYLHEGKYIWRNTITAVYSDGYTETVVSPLGINFNNPPRLRFIKRYDDLEITNGSIAISHVIDETINTVVPPSSSLPGTFYLNKDSYILTNDKADIEPVYPDISILPSDKLQDTTIGDKVYKEYIGDNLLKDYEDSIKEFNLDTILNPIPGSFVEKDGQIFFVPSGQTLPGSKPFDYTPTNPDSNSDWDLDPNIKINWEPLMNIGISEKFPFSLPWDLKRSFDVLVRPAKPIKFTVPMVTEEITIDLEEFDSWAIITRTFLSLIFVIMLIVLTRRFIGGS